MYEDRFDLTTHERGQIETLLAEFDAAGGRLIDRAGNSLDHLPVPGGRYAIGHDGKVYRYARKGTQKIPGSLATGAPRRTNVIEVWTGHWQKVTVNGQARYAKQTIWIPAEENVGAHRGSPLSYYKSRGYRHPFDEPSDPTPEEIEAMEGRDVQQAQAVYAKMHQLGFSQEDIERQQQAMTPAAPPKRPRGRPRKHPLPAPEPVQPLEADANVA